MSTFAEKAALGRDRDGLVQALDEANDDYRRGAIDRPEWVKRCQELDALGRTYGMRLAYRPWETDEEVPWK